MPYCRSRESGWRKRMMLVEGNCEHCMEFPWKRCQVSFIQMLIYSTGADSVFSQDVLRDLGFNPVTGKDYIHHRQDTGPESTPLDEPEQEVKCPGKISKDGGGLTENDGVIVFSSSP